MGTDQLIIQRLNRHETRPSTAHYNRPAQLVDC